MYAVFGIILVLALFALVRGVLLRNNGMSAGWKANPTTCRTLYENGRLSQREMRLFERDGHL